MRFSQKELDPDFVDFNSVNRAYHFPARTYVPFRARFMQFDPQLIQMLVSAYEAVEGKYTYAHANPAVLTDPTGRVAGCFEQDSRPQKCGRVKGVLKSPRSLPFIAEKGDNNAAWKKAVDAFMRVVLKYAVQTCIDLCSVCGPRAIVGR
jgi:hypothetical protein